MRPSFAVIGARLGERPPALVRAVLVVVVVVEVGTGTFDSLFQTVEVVPAAVEHVADVDDGGLFSLLSAIPLLSFVGEPLDAGRGLNTLIPLRWRVCSICC